ncbi:hypothetical protein [Campylobacter jejuni]|uniref:hypothetical protein n=1 Tax=Campylobacter jejuni TaxID=197 RepID=UPI0018932BF9|nr:hypothetical protein [Campylobacter jejuni]
MFFVSEEIERLGTEDRSIIVDEPALQLLSRVERLADLRARHITAEKDIPERRLQLHAAEVAISGILTRMERDGETDPRRLLLGASTVGHLRELVESRSGVDNAILNATRELADARRRVADAEEALSGAGTDVESEHVRDNALARLTTAVAASRDADHVARRRLAEKDREAAIATLTDQLRTLHPCP